MQNVNMVFSEIFSTKPVSLVNPFHLLFVKDVFILISKSVVIVKILLYKILKINALVKIQPIISPQKISILSHVNAFLVKPINLKIINALNVLLNVNRV
jgi:hypothetical protein